MHQKRRIVSKNAKKVSQTIPKIVTKATRTRSLAYTPKFKKFVRQNNQVLSKVKKLITINFDKLRTGQKITTANENIALVKYASGKHKGAANLMTLKARAGKRLFFIKITKGQDRNLAKRYANAEMILQKLGRKINGFTVRIIKPEFIYSEGITNRSLSNPGRTFFVSDFVDQSKVIQPINYHGKEREKIHETLEKVCNFMKQEGVILDNPQFNSFYEQKTKTIYLYDI